MSEGLDLVQVGDKERSVSDIMIDWMALSDGLHESWQDWMPFLVFGVPYAQIARIFEIDKSTVTNALKGNKDFARRVVQGRKLVKRQLHYVWLDQKAVRAWKNIDYYLEVDPFALNDDKEPLYDSHTRRLLLGEKAKMTRFVLQQLGLHVQRHEVTHNTPAPMFMGDATLASHVIRRIQEMQDGPEEERDVDVIAAEYRLITDDDSEVEKYKITEEEAKVLPAYAGERNQRVPSAVGFVKDDG